MPVVQQYENAHQYEKEGYPLFFLFLVDDQKFDGITDLFSHMIFSQSLLSILHKNITVARHNYGMLLSHYHEL